MFHVSIELYTWNICISAKIHFSALTTSKSRLKCLTGLSGIHYLTSEPVPASFNTPEMLEFHPDSDQRWPFFVTVNQTGVLIYCCILIAIVTH